MERARVGGGSATKVVRLVEGGVLWDGPSRPSDLALHSWGLHRSLGSTVELPEDLLDLSDGLVMAVPEEILRRPGGFGPAQLAAPDSSRTDRLMAFLGRSV